MNSCIMKLYLAILLFLFYSVHSYCQLLSNADCKDTIEYYGNGKVWKKYKNCPEGIIDTLYSYKLNGKLEAYFVFGARNSNQPIIRHFFYYSGTTREVVSQYILNEDNMPVDVGAKKYYRKDGTLMDSVIYENGKEIYRANFDKKGILQSEHREK